MKTLRTASAALSTAAGLLMAAALTSCVSPPPLHPSDDPRLEARRALIHGQYDAAPPITVVKGVQIRVADLDTAEIALRNRNDKTRTELRVPLQNPWRLRADRSAHRAEVDLQMAQLDASAARLDAETCFQSVEAQTHHLQSLAWARFRDDLALIQDWMGALLREKLITEPRFRVHTLGLRGRLLRTRPGAAPLGVPDPQAPPLPAIQIHPEALDLRDETLRTHLQRHPDRAAHQAEQALLDSRVARETSKRLPWLSWFALRYTPRVLQDRPILEGRFSIEIPLGLEARSKAQAIELRAASDRLAVDDQEARDALELRAALGDWHAFESEGAVLLDAQKTALEHRAIALSWIDQRAAQPSEAASLLEDAFAIESALIALRAEAGEARCRVLALSGTSQWPRREGDDQRVGER